MAPVFSKVAARNSALIGASVGIVYWISVLRLKNRLKKAEIDEVACAYAQKEGQKEKVQVDAKFFKQLKAILKIILPGIFSREALYVALIAGTLVGRTLCDIWMIHNGTVIERAIITQNVPLFRKSLEAFIIAMPMLSLVNNAMKFTLNELKLLFRSRLTKHLYSKYLSGITYYKMSNIDNRISNPDQLLTQDVDKFCASVTDLYSNISKPLLDIIIFVQRLASDVGVEGPSCMMIYLLIAGLILTRLRRPIGKMTMNEQKLEGEFRYVNSRLITNSEEIAFYRGHQREKVTMMHAFMRLFHHLKMSQHFNFTMGYIDNIIARYWATVVGYLLISRPFIGTKKDALSSSERLESYYKNGRMFVKLAEAIGRLVLAGREMTKLAGFTARITQLTTVLKELSEGTYVRTMVNDSREGQSFKEPPAINLRPGAGVIKYQDNIIKFDRVPLKTPNGDTLIQELSFEVKSGMNVLVHGPNGCGKSSLFRVLGELWPLFGGVLTKPAKEKLFYIPQRPYMTLGTFRDQIIYPDSQDDMKRKGVTDLDLQYFLELVQLTYLLEREGDWNSIKDWMDILSGGEKQRIAMARLFYHRPQFAILDECTSAVSMDVEGSMYQYCREVGITLFTVSHRKSLWKHHEYTLYMDGRGGYKFEVMDETAEAMGS
ncbi:ATP-binding cassette sub-family D member 3-like [Argiope bruennichi]|uniref:ATP-binding cassette sub-family D member 3 like protein n=1 Tax=Argiope bruennichi TaxID=94029 RepID=A0A8T0F623_ARGBR|nr:ATP-binding cassette sub-family D member 3-like [Argiope bruennichi]KAF8786587.1 ATP-binding cassette sub-family D member 3 like protein [Argiope bruennichi]